jgi:hypothetical protein
LFSKPLYSKGQNRWLEYIVTEPDKKVTLALLCSMLNTCCKFNPMSWSPNTIDPRDQLVAYCIHILLVLLNYSSKMDGNLDYNTSVKEKNAFRFYLSRIHRTQDCQFLMDGIHRVLSSPMQVKIHYTRMIRVG